MTKHRFFFYLLLALVTVAFAAIVAPFYSAILWAVVLAIMFHPLHSRVARMLGPHSNAAAAISLSICVCLVVVPGLAVIVSLFREGGKLYTRIKSGAIDLEPMARKIEDALPASVGRWFQGFEFKSFDELNASLSSGLMEGGSFFAERALSFGQGTFGFLVSASLMLYLLFFFFRDGRDLVGAFRRVVPLSEENTRQFSVKFTSVVRATVRGTLVIALVQAIIGGLAFRLLGLEPALLWSVVMFFVSLIPILGTSLIWVPAAIYLGLIGLWLKAVVLVAVGLLVIGLVDNLLRPRLVGKETRMPDYVVLLSTLGGLSVLGANGFVIGPLIAALFISAWDIFTEEAQAKTPKL